MEEQNTPQLLQDLHLPTSYFISNRQNLKKCLGDNYLVILAAGRPPRRTADEDYRFFANRNFFYVTGIEQKESILLLFRSGDQQREILFIPPRDAMDERWTGRRLGLDEAAAQSGLAEIEYLSTYEGILTDLLTKQNTRIWVDQSAQNAQADEIQNWLNKHHSDREVASLAPFLTQLRMIKSPEEIAMLREAINLTGRGIKAMLEMLEPGKMEYHLVSAFEYTLAMEGCPAPAFASIVASGENAFCLHYMNPRSEIRDGDLVQIDVGAIAGGLCADISRAFPSNGRFSPRQLAIYQEVRKCQEVAFATIKPGIKLSDINDRCKESAREGLTELGILAENAQVSDYYWHGVSHHLGLDVHDVSNREALLQPGMVLTVEPGIYVPEWQVGLRIEDDVLVTENGCHILSQSIPREASEIELALQNNTGLL